MKKRENWECEIAEAEKKGRIVLAKLFSVLKR